MPVQIRSKKRLHVFAANWQKMQKQLSEKKQKICEDAKWSEQTFYNKLALALKNKLVLTENEARALSAHLNLDVQDLLTQNYKN